MADSSLVDGLGRRGYRLTGFEGFLAMPLSPDDPPPAPPPPGIEIRPAGPDEADLYSRVVTPNFAGPEGPSDEFFDPPADDLAKPSPGTSGLDSACACLALEAAGECCCRAAVEGCAIW